MDEAHHEVDSFRNNALRDIVMYQEALRSKSFPGHHTTGTTGAEGSSAPLYASLLRQQAIMEAPVGQWSLGEAP
jgi:hypothetical protein